MSHDTIPEELRELVWKIEELVRESRVASMANEPVRMLADWLTLRARVIELDRERDRLQRELDARDEEHKYDD